MAQERGLAPATVLRYENTARRFLQEQATDGDTFTPAALSGADVNAFLLRECARVSSGSAKGRVAELRSILRFLYLQGVTPLRLAGCRASCRWLALRHPAAHGERRGRPAAARDL